MNYSNIYKYWNSNPCGGGNEKFPYWLFKNKKVLEIGCGLGVDALRFVTNGAYYTGIDLTHKAILSSKAKIGSRGALEVMNAEFLDFPDDYFDLVYSWGVVHHTVNPRNVMREAHRVLKKDGLICIMVYNKFSIRYWFDIMFVRKILRHLRYYKYTELRRINPKPSHTEWVSWNTDTLGCPLARVYSKKEAELLLHRFNITKSWTENYGWFRVMVGRK